MRTTVNIDDDMLERARVLAVRSGRPLGAIVTDALRVLLTPRESDDVQPRVSFPTVSGSGLQPGVDLEDKDSLARVLGDEARLDGG